ncbi:MAG TPA: hypothetical protein VK672_07505, partial [Solirubrobacteraceae bacterium]|nr:hypothetical protein [Solirubrobacteraceae bacterium]
VTDWINECGNPLCDNLGPDLPAIKGALNLIQDGAILAYIAAAIAYPNETAAVTDSLVIGPISTAANAIEALV